MREAIYHVFVVVVARARVPCHHQLCLWTQLHHTLRHRGSGEGATAQRAGLVGLRSDERIDKSSVVVCDLGAHQQRQQQGRQECSVFFHFASIFGDKSKEKSGTFAKNLKSKNKFQ